MAKKQVRVVYKHVTFYDSEERLVLKYSGSGLEFTMDINNGVSLEWSAFGCDDTFVHWINGGKGIDNDIAAAAKLAYHVEKNNRR